MIYINLEKETQIQVRRVQLTHHVLKDKTHYLKVYFLGLGLYKMIMALILKPYSSLNHEIGL